MARMNPKRRRKVAQAKAFRDIVDSYGKAHDDSHLLQRGKVRSSYTRIEAIAPVHAKMIAHRANSAPSDSRGKGSMPNSQRFAANHYRLGIDPHQPVHTRAADTVFSDSARTAAAKLILRRKGDK